MSQYTVRSPDSVLLEAQLATPDAFAPVLAAVVARAHADGLEGDAAALLRCARLYRTARALNA